jgi:hypothetical protein
MYLIIPGLDLFLLVFALVDIIRADRWTIRYLEKSTWIIIVILLPLIGSILWFAVGRQYDRPHDLGSFGDPRRREDLAPSEGNTERELAALEIEIERHERDARLRALEAKMQARLAERAPESPES